MGKRPKHRRLEAPAGNEGKPREQSPLAIAAEPPAKNRALLAFSLALFAAWFLFLLATAILSQQ